MGVPKQVIDMESEGDKDTAVEVTEPTPGADPQSATPRVEDKPADAVGAGENPQRDGKGLVSSVVDGDGDSDEEERKRMQREASATGRLKKLQGELRSQREAYERKISEMTSRIKTLEDNAALREEQDRNIPDTTETVTDEGLFGEIRKEFGSDEYSDDDLKRFIRVVSKIGNGAVDVRRIKAKVEEMESERIERDRRAAKAEADSFKERLERDFPGFAAIDAGNDPRWIAFLDSTPGGIFDDVTYKDIAMDALKTLNYRKFSGVVREFATKFGIVFSKNRSPIDSSVVGQIRPDAAGEPKRGIANARPQTFSASEIEAFRRAAFAHKAERVYGMTTKQVAERLAAYEDAEADGRVTNG